MKIIDSQNHTTGARASGPGGNHVGHFGRQLMLRAPEDEGGGGGTGGTPAAVETNTTTPGNPPAEGASKEKLFTQADVDAIVRKRLERKLEPSKPANAAGDGEQHLSLKQLAAENAEIKLRLAFDKRAAKFNLDEDAADELFELYKLKPPEDPAAWFEKKSKFFSAPSNTTTNTTSTSSATTPTQQTSEQRPPASQTAPGKVDPITSGGLVDLWNISLDQLNQLGPEGVRREYEKILSAHTSRSGAPPLPKMPQKNR